MPTRIGEMQIGMMYDECMEKEHGPYQPGKEPTVNDQTGEQPRLPDNVIPWGKVLQLHAAREAIENSKLQESKNRHPAYIAQRKRQAHKKPPQGPWPGNEGA